MDRPVTPRSGPLADVRVLELGGVGPVPFCGMSLADLGADVVRVERPMGDDTLSRTRRSLNLLARGKRSIAMDFRSLPGRDIALDLVRRSDIVIEGFRPGVLERLGLGPGDCLEVNPRLVYGRMSGWGKGGPLAGTAAHDINYLAMSGLLATIGTEDQPLPPLNIIGDFGGALYLVAGLLAALTHARATGNGQVVEASIFGGSLGLMAQLFAIKDHGDWVMQRQSNWMDGGAPFYRTYRTADDRFMAVGAIEPQFYKALLDVLGLAGKVDPADQMKRETWPRTTELIAAAFAGRSQAEWVGQSRDVEACCTPVLDLDEARRHSQALAAGHFCDVGGRREPAPQPAFSATPTAPPAAAAAIGGDAKSVLEEIGLSPAQMDEFFDAGVVSRP